MADDILRAASDAVQRHLKEAGTAYALEGSAFTIGKHRLEVSLAFDAYVPQGNLFLAPVDIQMHVDDDTGDQFRVGVLGVGDTPAAARDDAIAEWHLLAAAPVLAALGAAVERRRASSLPERLADWRLFAGSAGIRGKVPAELRAGSGFYRSLVARLHQVVAGWTDPTGWQLRSIFLMATRSPEGCEVQAAVDGLLEQPLVETCQALPWPSSDETYLYKQLFVLRGGDA